MKVGIVGSREYDSYRKIKNVVHKLKERFGDELVIVSGGQRQGADGYAKKAAIELEVKYVEFPPEHYSWNQYCIKEPKHYDKPYAAYRFFERNSEIAEYSDIVFCFVPSRMKIEESRGTNDTHTKALKLGKKSIVIN